MSEEPGSRARWAYEWEHLRRYSDRALFIKLESARGLKKVSFAMWGFTGFLRNTLTRNLIKPFWISQTIVHQSTHVVSKSKSVVFGKSIFTQYVFSRFYVITYVEF